MHAPAASHSLRLFLRGVLAALVVVSALACSSSPTLPAPPPPQYEDLLAMAGDFSVNGNERAAMELYRRAAAIEPARKQPWQHLARIHQAAGRPGPAFVAAEEVLHRDPADPFANGVYIASALEIAGGAMQRLLASGAAPRQDDLARAQRLVATMGQVFGDDELVTDEFKARYAQRAVQRHVEARSRLCRSPPPEPQEKAQPDPLEVLGGD